MRARRSVVRITVAAALVAFVASCASLRNSGDAVECAACRAVWIRLLADSPAPGLYLLDEKQGSGRPCAHCQELAVRFFETGILVRRCVGCGGELQPRRVDFVR